MDWNKLLINSEQLHWITGRPISECRELWKKNYLNPKIELQGLAKYDKSINPQLIGSGFETGWYKLHENKSFMLNEPFKLGFFKRTRKINFLISILPDEHVREIEENWKLKQEMLNNQMSFK